VRSAALLAFGFFDPWLLWGLALGSAPIIIHMMYKRRYKESPWAAMQFLMAAARKNSRRIRLEQLMLLTVRVLILLLVALALAQPYVESLGTSVDADQPAHRILVVDASFSMGYQDGEFSRFERAKNVARQIVSTGRQGDAFQLIQLSDASAGAIVRQPAYQQEPVLDEIERLAITEESGDVLAAIRRVPQMLEDAPRLLRKEVYVISDMQAASWKPPATDKAAQLHDLVDGIAKRARLTCVDLGNADSPNAAVTRLGTEQSFVEVERPVQLRTTVRNYGAAPLNDHSVEVYINDRLAETRLIDVSADSETRIAFTVQFETPGEHRVEVRLEDDALTLDNRRHLVVTVHDELHVLLVDGRRSGLPEQAATYYLQTVLSPQTRRRSWEGSTQPRVISEGELLSADLSLYDCVFLCDVGRIVEAEFDLLHAYVRSGGALVFCLGEQVDADNYNQILYRDAKGVLPAKLGDRRGNADAPSEDSVRRFNANELAHPIVNPFAGNLGAGLETTLVFEYFSTVLPESSVPAGGNESATSSTDAAGDGSLPSPTVRSRVALWFDTGDPAIIEAQVENGRSILVTTSLDNRWGPWPLQRSFPPLVHETVRFAVSGAAGGRRTFVGEPLMLGLPMPAYDLRVTLKQPGFENASAVDMQPIGSARLLFADTARSGFYEFAIGPPLNRGDLFAVNVDPAESDLTGISEEQLQTELFPDIDFAYRTRWDEFERSRDIGLADRGSLSRWLLVSALCLIFVEQLMAWRFLYGFLLLYVVTAIGFLRPALAWSLPAGVMLGLIFGTGLAAMWLWPRLGHRRQFRRSVQR